jgi:hypothetical protein
MDGSGDLIYRWKQSQTAHRRRHRDSDARGGNAWQTVSVVTVSLLALIGGHNVGSEISGGCAEAVARRQVLQ